MTQTRRGFLALCAALPAALLAVRARATARVHEIDIALFQFQPATLTIAPGDTVRWTNRDGIEHSATAGDSGADGAPLFDTGLFERGESRDVTFSEPGNYDYFCTRHPSMTGRIEVVG